MYPPLPGHYYLSSARGVQDKVRDRGPEEQRKRPSSWGSTLSNKQKEDHMEAGDNACMYVTISAVLRVEKAKRHL